MSENPSDVEVCVRKLSWRGFWTAMRASTYTAHARRLARRGATSAALRKALHALELLRSPHVHRFWPGTFVDIVEGAKLVDELTTALDCPEKATRPLTEALELVRADIRASQATGHDADGVSARDEAFLAARLAARQAGRR